MLTSEQIQIIKELQAVGIKNKTLSGEQLALAYQNNWFNLWVPKSLNGFQNH